MVTRRTFVKEASFAMGIAVVSGVVGCSDERTLKEATMGMKFSELIEARRSVRKYAKATISKDEMTKIVEEALNAPSWKNTETTRYYAAIGDDAKAKLWSDALPGFNAASSANAAALVAVSFVPGESGYMGDTPADELGEMWGAYDCGLASSYFILADSRKRGPHVRHCGRQVRPAVFQESPQARRRSAEDDVMKNACKNKR